MRISDWSSDVCSSDLASTSSLSQRPAVRAAPQPLIFWTTKLVPLNVLSWKFENSSRKAAILALQRRPLNFAPSSNALTFSAAKRSEEHTSELQSLMRISYAVFCLKKKKTPKDWN